MAGMGHRHFQVTYFAFREFITNKKYFTCFYFLKANWILCSIISLVECCKEKIDIFYLLMNRGKKDTKSLLLTCEKKINKF